MVVIISFCVVLTGIVVPSANASLAVNVLEAQKNTENIQYIIVEGKKYKIILEEVK